MRFPLAVVTVLLATACSTSSAGSTAAPVPTSSPAPQGPVSVADLQARLLKPEDLPELTDRRESGSADLTTQATPQLALCTPATTVGPHELASVLAKPAAVGQVQVFELLSAYTSASDARQAFDLASSAAAGCSTFSEAGTAYRVVDLARPAIPGADAALQYRLTTPTVVGGDVRTLALSGTLLVLLTGYGAPPQGQTLLQYQAAAMAKALDRTAS